MGDARLWGEGRGALILASGAARLDLPVAKYERGSVLGPEAEKGAREQAREGPEPFSVAPEGACPP